MEKTGYFVLVSVYLAAAAFFDQRTGKVPNRLIVAGLALGGARVFLPAPCGALLSLRSAAAGIALPFFLLFPFFCLRLMGAGDIKLLMAAGACGGPDVVLRCMLIAFAAAGLYGVIRHLWWKGAAQAGTRALVLTHFSTSMEDPAEFLESATGIFQETTCATDGQVFSLRYPAR